MYFDKKFKDKTGLKWEDRQSSPKNKKYVFIERSYEPDSDNEAKPVKKEAKIDVAVVVPPSTLPLPVQMLMKFIFNQDYFREVMAEMEYDADKLPLGKLSRRTLEQGYQTLKVWKVRRVRFKH
jgi:poly [ADP-ribose] polymerase